MSENAEFADICDQCGITFIGPKVSNMLLMGDKSQARQTAIENNVPVIPGSDEAGTDVEEALAIAERIGFPVLLKASAGGGGRGMKAVHEKGEFKKLFLQAEREVEAAFGDGRIYIEKFLPKARHVEVQIVGDKHGNIIHLGERDCSIQRRYQKLIEETPAVGLKEETIVAIREAALKLSRAISYSSVGTLEFLVDPSTEEFYFIEMNTRLQVEHPVTEMVTRTDVVKEQIWVASGRELSFKQSDIQMSGHAIEARINAEDPVRMCPSPGEIVGFHPPGGPGVRVDSALYDRYKVPPHYDSLIAKIIAWGSTREEAIQKLLVALDEFLVGGISTNIELHRRVLMNEDFQRGDVHTRLLETISLVDEPEQISAKGGA